ncbi:serine/threonine protein kinase [Archangium violaceum]|uniref:serine/threonine protein kinase n=1 Tax=Archangium violaceum TaxID=83451 RepID=UPI0036D910A0
MSNVRDNGQNSTRLGRYELLGELGHGGMAKVYRARAAGPMGFEKTLVVKRILSHLAEDPQFVEMFLSEARLAAQLNHPNIVQIFDFGEAEGSYFLAMEFIDGPNLRALMRRAYSQGRPLPLPHCARIIAAACEGLAYAHEFVDPATGEPVRLIHRDVSPDNILLARTGSVKLVDFGIAKAANQVHETRVGTLKGKVPFMAPEQLKNEQLDLRIDVYALGVVLYELVTGRKPYEANSEVAMIQAILFEPFTPLSARRPDVPEPLQRIIEKALAKDREVRYLSCREMQADLEAYLLSSGQPVSAFQLAELITQLSMPPGAATASLGTPSPGSSSRKLLVTSPGPAASPKSGTVPSVKQAAGSGAVVPPPPPVERTEAAATLASHTLAGKVAAPATAAPVGKPASVLSPEPPTQDEEPSSRRRWTLAAVAAAVVLVVGGAAVVALRSGEAPPPVVPVLTPVVAQPAPPAPPVPEPAAAPAPRDTQVALAAVPQEAAQPVPEESPAVEEIEFEVEVVPRDARVYLDGKPLPSNPYTGFFPKDDERHELRVTAAGFSALTKKIRFEKDIYLQLNLQRRSFREVEKKRGPARVAQKRPVEPTPVPAAAQPQPADGFSELTPKPAAGARGAKRTIDSDDPWNTPQPQQQQGKRGLDEDNPWDSNRRNLDSTNPWGKEE